MQRPIKYNLVSNYASQFYVMGIGVVMAPIYLSYMGQEAYGLIGFFTVMSAWFQLLDIGLTPTLVRETARFRGGAITVDALRALLRALELIFGAVSVTAGAAMVILSGWIAVHWLNVEHLSVSSVALSIAFMGATIPLRWVAGLYRGVVNGFERQVWLGGYNIAIATLRFVGVLAIFKTFGATPENFFTYQLVLAFVELGGLAAMTYRLIRRDSNIEERFSWAPLLANLPFSLTIAFTATVWLGIMQTDRLLLSKMLTLSAYGVFSIAIVAAATITALGAALGQAVLPRLTKFAAENNITATVSLYRAATQVTCVVAAPIVTIFVFYAGPVLMAWTGRPEVVAQAVPILRLYAIGNFVASLYAFPYFLQYAKGNLRIHLTFNIVQVLLFVPLVFFAAKNYGPVGTGTIWALSNLIYFLIYAPLVHRRFLPGIHNKWILRDILVIVTPVAIVGGLLSLIMPWSRGRLATFAETFALGLLLLTVAGASSKTVRSALRGLMGSRVNA